MHRAHICGRTIELLIFLEYSNRDWFRNNVVLYHSL